MNVRRLLDGSIDKYFCFIVVTRALTTVSRVYSGPFQPKIRLTSNTSDLQNEKAVVPWPNLLTIPRKASDTVIDYKLFAVLSQ